MNKSRLFGTLFGSVLSLFVTTIANAALVGVLPATSGGTDYQAYYDDVTDVTWLADANAAGRMTWADANTWAAGLDINGVTGWRLPDTLQPDPSCDSQNDPGGSFPVQGSGYNCTGSELGNLFYNVLGGTAHVSITTTHNSNYDLFSNVQSDLYWAATEYAPDISFAWGFYFGNGNQGYDPKSSDIIYAWAVHDGNADVDTDGVPNHLDQCPDTPSGAVVNSDGCSIDQLCPCDGPMESNAPWGNHHQYTSCVAHAVKDFMSADLLTKREGGWIKKVAGRSSCGKN